MIYADSSLSDLFAKAMRAQGHSVLRFEAAKDLELYFSSFAPNYILIGAAELKLCAGAFVESVRKKVVKGSLAVAVIGEPDGELPGEFNYFLEPFDAKEIAAHAERHALRHNHNEPFDTNTTDGNVIDLTSLDSKTRSVRVGERKTIKLAPIEFRILIYFLNHKNVAVDRASIVEACCLRSTMSLRSVDVYVCKLRNKLGEHGLSIRTLPKVGYIISDLQA